MRLNNYVDLSEIFGNREFRLNRLNREFNLSIIEKLGKIDQFDYISKYGLIEKLEWIEEFEWIYDFVLIEKAEWIDEFPGFFTYFNILMI